MKRNLFFIIFIFFIFSNVSAAQSIVGTQTEKNLLTAFIGESETRNHYDFFASAANSENLQSIGKIFTETAAQEKEHAERFFKFLERTDFIDINHSFRAGKIGDTKLNLAQAIMGEHKENSDMYLDMARVAKEEGFDDIAEDFENIAVAEMYHERRFMTILTNLEQKTYFSKAEPVTWKCTNCGYHAHGRNAPDKCPSCEHPMGYFIEVREEYF